jgi:hypothetical protein
MKVEHGQSEKTAKESAETGKAMEEAPAPKLARIKNTGVERYGRYDPATRWKFRKWQPPRREDRLDEDEELRAFRARWERKWSYADDAAVNDDDAAAAAAAGDDDDDDEDEGGEKDGEKERIRTENAAEESTVKQKTCKMISTGPPKLEGRYDPATRWKFQKWQKARWERMREREGQGEEDGEDGDDYNDADADADDDDDDDGEGEEKEEDGEDGENGEEESEESEEDGNDERAVRGRIMRKTAMEKKHARQQRG